MKTGNHNDLLIRNMLYSCVDKKQRGNEQYVYEHSLGYIVSGQVNLETNIDTVICQAGQLGLVKKNQLIRSQKIPPADGSGFKAVNIILTQEILRMYSAENHIVPDGNYTGEPVQILADDPVIKGFFNSLLPYFDHPAQLTDRLIKLKTNEAIELLLQRNSHWKNMLFDFSEPHKIDIEQFMNENFKFKVPAAHFAQLTGRSITVFKKDFEKIFKTSPGRWLQKKRLEEAYYQIKQQGRKPSEVYLDVGFENLSHFSYAFKNEYGISPSLLTS